jgi:hypothetical protein
MTDQGWMVDDGTYQIVVSFQVAGPLRPWLGIPPLDALRDDLLTWAEAYSDGIATGTLDIAVREHGAGGRL